MIDFHDTEIAYRYKSTSQLKLAKWMYVLLNSVIGSVGKKLLKFAVNAGLPIKPIIKATLYQHFVGGETKEECKVSAQKMSKYGVQSILDFSEEGKESESDFKHAFEELIQSVEAAGKEVYFPICVFKITAFVSHNVLEKVSSGIKLNADEQIEWNKARERFDALIHKAVLLNRPIMVDAEESWIQKAIDDVTLEAMRKYNKEQGFVMNTYQMYKKDSLSNLKRDYETAQKEGFILGAKIVRGAYMEKERARAIEKGYPSPIQDTKADSDKAFNEAVAFILERINDIKVLIGSHNIDSNALADRIIRNTNIPHTHPNIWFSQLYGMCDYLSFNLANSGYQVAKYLPYGPVKSVTPYLIRRADENSSVAGQAGIEIANIKKELLRRKS